VTQTPEIIPLLIYIIATIGLFGLLLTVTWWLGEKSTNRNKEMPYESGIIPSGSARLLLTVPFYLIAIFFIVFDVETAFIFTWAVVWQKLGLMGLFHITFFIVALLVGLAWLWIKKGLEWGPSRMREQHESD
jgi:NADH-quinone oxidoreductase subunit A